MVSSALHCQVPVRTSSLVPTDILALWPPHSPDKAFSPSVPPPAHNTWDQHSRPRPAGSWLSFVRLHLGSVEMKASRRSACNRSRNRTLGALSHSATLPLALHSFSFSEFYVQPAIKTGKTSKSYTHPRKCWFVYSINNTKSQQMQIALHPQFHKKFNPN